MDLWGRVMAAVDAFRNFDQEPELTVLGRYDLRWGLYDGTLFDETWRSRPLEARDPRLYVNTRLLWKQVESTVDFYATTIYQGSLSTDGEPLPGGQPEAIPIDPQTGDETKNTALRRGIAELWNAGNWRQQMLIRPMYGACLGSVLTELVDYRADKKVLPVTCWPGYVVDIELDSVGNVKWVAIEYPVEVKRRSKADTTTVEEEYMFRKELSGEDFLYFKDDKLFDTRPNPYRLPDERRGFVPAIWDRHKQVPGDFGHCAFEGTIPALLEVNSFLSHGLDYKRKQFAAPIVIQGNLSSDPMTFGLGFNPGDTVAAKEAAAYAAEGQDILTVTGDRVGIHTIDANISGAMELLNWIKAGIDRENPEGGFYERLGQAGNLTGPGADRALGDATSRCRWARAGYDTQSIKLFQMWLAIAGMRVNSGDWGDRGQLSRRQQAWLPFGLESHRAGDLDFIIKDRGVVMQTEEEVVNLVILKETVQTEWGMKEVGIPDDAIATVQSERQQQREAMASAFSVAGSTRPPQSQEGGNTPDDGAGNADQSGQGAGVTE